MQIATSLIVVLKILLNNFKHVVEVAILHVILYYITDIEQMHNITLFFQELIGKLSKGELAKNEYPCMNDPSPTFHGTSNPASIRSSQAPPVHSMRQRRTPTWARPRNSDDGYSRYFEYLFLYKFH